MNFTLIDAKTPLSNELSNSIVDFLFIHLEAYGDEKSAIQKCIDYVMHPEKGGVIIIGKENETIVGITIINKTGMSDFIPENILVYIAVDGTFRGKGYGKKLMQKAINTVEGSIALHVEPENPARKLYESLGFTNKYLEMRLTK
ncbi:MAG: GNAT family N-acetyltransferase [Flavobacterium sp.]|jgi:GNAT superfamily N-acetyltransferase|nr:GNAT family N-acetyltransferase [Flavobacterium sp.]